MRTRDLKPDFWTDEKVVQVSDAAKLMFQGLWNIADREGRLEDKPVAIGFKVRPWDPMRAAELIDELERFGLIERYQADGLKLILIPTLPRHQRFHPREMKSKLPPQPPKGSPRREKDRLGEQRHAIAPGSAGPSGSAGPAGPSGSSGPSTPPLPPSARGAEVGGEVSKNCTCKRHPCRHEKPPTAKPQPYDGVARQLGACAACGRGAEAEFAGVKLCYGGCLTAAEAWAREREPDKPWAADVVGWAMSQRAMQAARAAQ